MTLKPFTKHVPGVGSARLLLSVRSGLVLGDRTLNLLWINAGETEVLIGMLYWKKSKKKDTKERKIYLWHRLRALKFWQSERRHSTCWEWIESTSLGINLELTLSVRKLGHMGLLKIFAIKTPNYVKLKGYWCLQRETNTFWFISLMEQTLHASQEF